MFSKEFDPEDAHLAVLKMLQVIESQPRILSLVEKTWKVRHPSLEVDICGLRLRNPIMLAAGFDKNAVAPYALSALGFSGLEFGTVTPKPQEGNQRPRMWRVPNRAAIINHMGMPNVGLEEFIKNLGRIKPERDFAVGVSIGSSDTDGGKLVEDYSDMIEAILGKVRPSVDYLTINTSCPNIHHNSSFPREPVILERILSFLREKAGKELPNLPPIFVKISPDLSDSEIKAIGEMVQEANSALTVGIIATNTTTSRPDGLPHLPGGLSGLPLKRRSTEVVRSLYRLTEGKVPIIGVGGIFDFCDVLEKMGAGASSVQIFTGLVYGGPLVVRKINRQLLRYVQNEGITVKDLIGRNCS